MPMITVNGTAQFFAGGTLADWLAQNPPPPPFAVSLNHAFVPKPHYAATALCDGDELEIVRPVVGG